MMVAGTLRRHLALGGLLLGTSQLACSSFMPFADIEELKPQPLEKFCGVGEDGTKKGLRWCSHEVNHVLEDEGEVKLSWRMQADPDSILSLDTEAHHGVRLLRCTPGELELELPDSHARHAAEGHLVMASRFVHSCSHLGDRHMYHRVKTVLRHEQRHAASVHVVHLSTEELPSIAHVVPSLTMDFRYTPVEARDVVPFPKKRTNVGVPQQPSRGPTATTGRRLGVFDALSHFASTLENGARSSGIQVTHGGMQAGGGDFHSPTVQTNNSLLNFSPKQMSNFGWNWDFEMNTTQEPEFDISSTGAQGKVLIREPYIKLHSGLYLHFSSVFGSIVEIPRVNWVTGLDGHGRASARIIARLNSTANAGVDPIDAMYDIANEDVLEALRKLATPQWFQKIDIATGSIPVSIQPGMQLQTQLYHKGPCKGAINVGGATHGPFNVSLSYDSERGFATVARVEPEHTEIWPPMWMIFTEQFEMGLVGQPSFMVRGDFGGGEATMKLDARPFLNLTVSRTGEDEGAQIAPQTPSTRAVTLGGTPAGGTKKVTAYPWRVMGLPQDEHKLYKVKIEAFGQTQETSPEANWGQVSFHDHISAFNMGSVEEHDVMAADFKVYLYKQDGATDTETLMGEGIVRCTAIMNGACHPTPSFARIRSGGSDDGSGEGSLTPQEIAIVEVDIFWGDAPETWFASKIRGLGVAITQVSLAQQPLTEFYPYGINNNTLVDWSVHLVHMGMTIGSRIVPNGGTLIGDRTFEFGPSFMESWAPCPPAATHLCTSPRLELYQGTQLVASNDLPEVEWTSQTAMQGTRGSILSGHAQADMRVPITVALRDEEQTTTYAVVRMAAVVTEAQTSSMFLPTGGASSSGFTIVQPGSVTEIAWTIAEVDRSKVYTFTITPLRKQTVAQSDMAPITNRVGPFGLDPVPAARKTLPGTRCSPRSIEGIQDSESPCSFSDTWQWTSDFQSGDIIAFQVEWMDHGAAFTMVSPPFEVAATARRLKGSSGGRANLASPRRLGHGLLGVVGAPPTSGITTPTSAPTGGLHGQSPGSSAFFADWQREYDQFAESCEREDLHFDLGAGLLYRGEVEAVMPEGFPIDAEPSFRSDWKPVVTEHPQGADADELTPTIACKLGLCSGALPGCTQATSAENATVLYKPHMQFFFNRQLSWANASEHTRVTSAMKAVMAYAFSAMPEAVDILLKSLNETAAQVQDRSNGNMEPGDRVDGWSECPGPHCDEHGAGGLWASGQNHGRRLGEVKHRKDDREEEQEVHLHFREGLPFKVTRPLVDTMLKVGSFGHIEDGASREKGPLQITRFYILDEGKQVLSKSESKGIDFSATSTRQKARGLPMGFLFSSPLHAAAACVGLFALAGGFVMTMLVLTNGDRSLTSWIRGTAQQHPQSDSDDSDVNEGLE